MPCYRPVTKKSNLIQSIRLAPQEHDGRNVMGPTRTKRAALQNGFKKHCKTAVGVQKIPESRSALQSGCKVALKRQVIFVTGNALPLVSTKKRNAGSNNAIIKINGRGVDKALMRVNTTRKSK